MQNGPNCHDCGSQENTLLAAQALTQSKGKNGTQKAANIVDGRYCREIFGSGGTHQVVQFEEVGGYDHAT